MRRSLLGLTGILLITTLIPGQEKPKPPPDEKTTDDPSITITIKASREKGRAGQIGGLEVTTPGGTVKLDEKTWEKQLAEKLMAMRLKEKGKRPIVRVQADASLRWSNAMKVMDVAYKAKYEVSFIKPVDELPEKPRQSGLVKADVTRPDHFPHRIWAACDFEGRTPDYAWFGPSETKNIPKYPGNVTALGFNDKPYQNFSALMTGINPVPGPRMGKVNQLYLRYYLEGGSEATFQYFSLTREDNNHIRVTGLTEGKWSELTLNFTRDARRNDGSDQPFADGERMDDFKVFVGKPGDGKKYKLFLDDIIFFSDDPKFPPEKEPFPNRVIFLASFDTGPKEKYWPGEFDIVEKDLPADSYWRVARAVPRKEGKGKWIRLQIAPPRPVGEHTKLRFRYHITGASNMTVQVFDTTDQDNRHIHMKGLKQGQWTTAYLDFTKDGKRNDGKDTPFAAGHKVDDLFFFVEPDGKEEVKLLIDEVVLYDAGRR
jgi:hypothetical protein